MASYTYIQAIGVGFPSVQCHALGDGSVYSDLVWDGGAPLPSQTTLDQWIAANPEPAPMLTLTKYQFRKLFTVAERVAIDNFDSNLLISAQNKAFLTTIMKDLDLSGDVELNTNPDVSAGVNFLETVGLLGTGRAAQILSNTPPA